MKNCIVALIASLLLTSGSSAGVMSLTLDPRGVDLTNLTVGDVVTIDVVLDRLAVGRLTDLGATVEISAPDDFSDPTANVVAGAIIPDPADFFSAAGFSPGSVDGQFSTLFSSSLNPEIDTNGVFYSFDIAAATPGTGVIRFGCDLMIRLG